MAVDTDLRRRASRLIPGGVNSPVRAMRAVGFDEPVFMARGEGAVIEDVDGNRYVDWVQSWGPLIFGHADPETLQAVHAAADRGTSFGAPTEAEVELAAEIAANAPLAVQATKRTIDMFADQGLDDALRFEAMNAAVGFVSEDLVEGFAAGREKRSARFEGK